MSTSPLIVRLGLLSRWSRTDPAARALTLIALCVLAGLALRLRLLIAAGWRYDYDEGMVGLQVLRILGGARPAFHPGQPYLAALESYLIAPLFALFGANAITLKLVPWLLSGGYVASTGALGWRGFGPRAGTISALLAALAPAYLLVVGMKTWGATAETLVLGNLALLLASYALDLRLTEAQRGQWLTALALVGGVGCWVSWLIAFYGLPILLLLLIRTRPLLRRRVLSLLIAFAVGSAPLWAYNVQHGWATFDYLLGQEDAAGADWRAVLHHLNYDLAPRLVSGDPDWQLLSWPATWWLQIVYQGGLLALLGAAWSRRLQTIDTQRQTTRELLALFVLSVPALYLISGWGARALNPFGFDATGRYLLMLHSTLPIGVAALLTRLREWRIAGMRLFGRLSAAAILLSVIMFNLVGAARIDPVPVFTSPYYTRQPPTLDPLISYLDEQNIMHVWTDVGVAHVLMFQTEERILAADWYDIYGAGGIVRFPEVPLAIAAAERVAYVEVVLPSQQDTAFERAFRASGVPHEVTRVSPHLLVIVPLAPIDPAVLGDGLGYQF